MTLKPKQLFRCLAALCLAAPAWAQSQADSEPLRVQDVQCAGNQNFSCEFIREHLYLRAGELLDEEEVRNAELRLSASRVFKSASVRLTKGARRGEVIVVIEVTEDSPVRSEWQLGASLQPDLKLGNFAGRVSNHNLFGRAKVGEVSVQAVAPLARAGASGEGYNFTMSYADPQLFGSHRYFGTASAGWARSRFADADGNFSTFDAAQLNLSMGRRFGDFSYVMVELNFRPDSDWSYGWWNTDPIFQTNEHHGRGTKATLIYGWSSEDDQYFPTQGSALQLAARRDFGANAPDRYSFLRYRKTWEAMGGYLSFSGAVMSGQLLSLTYARPVAPGASIERGRWYVEPGILGIGVNSSGQTRVSYGLKAGFRAETRQFGFIDLYLSGIAESER